MMVEVSGPNPALFASLTEPVPVSAYGHDLGYELGITVPRFMNRLANTLALAVFFGLLPVSLIAYFGRAL